MDLRKKIPHEEKERIEIMLAEAGLLPASHPINIRRLKDEFDRLKRNELAAISRYASRALSDQSLPEIHLSEKAIKNTCFYYERD